MILMRYAYDHISAKDAPSLLARLNELGQQGWHVIGWSYERHAEVAHGALIERVLEAKQQQTPPITTPVQKRR